jgi:hypothetical protein
MEACGGSPDRNRALMRELNERAAHAVQLEPADEVEVVCECGDIACFEVVSITVADYETIVAEGADVLAPGHRAPARSA